MPRFASSPAPTVERGKSGAREGSTTVALYLWALIPILFPIYLREPGSPQVSAYLTVLVALVLLFTSLRFPGGSKGALVPLVWFLWDVCVVNLAWVGLSENPKLLLPPVFYLYNAVAFAVVLVLYARAGGRFLRIAKHSTFIAIAVQVLAVFRSTSGSLRSVAYFDNPNQLGYFALAAAAIFLTLSESDQTAWWYRGLALSMSLFLVLKSASFAALGGFGLLAVFLLSRRPVMTVLAAGLMIALVSLHGQDLFLGDRIESESEELEDTTFLESRGYDRIVDHPEHIIFGAGEGNYDLYRSAIGKHEIHSSYGTLLFCYGIIGSLLFLAFIYGICSHAGLRNSLYLAPVLLYGFAHQGLRSTMLWMLFGLVWSVGAESRKRLTPAFAQETDSGVEPVAPLNQAGIRPKRGLQKPHEETN